MDFKSKLTQDSHTLKCSGWSSETFQVLHNNMLYKNQAFGAIHHWSLDLFLTHVRKECLYNLYTIQLILKTDN